MWVCGKCYQENAATDYFCSNCKHPNNNKNVDIERVSDKEVTLRQSQCDSQTKSQEDPCSKRRTKQPKVAVVTPVFKAPSDGIEVPQCTECGSPTESQHDVCSNCSAKQLELALDSQVSKAPCDGEASKELRIVLLGKTGAGKSATGNTLLNEDRFVSTASLKSVTDKCQHEKKRIWGRNIMIVDTPGLLDTKMTKKQVNLEIKKSVAMSSPGPHVFLFVISLAGRFTEEEKTVLREFEFLFEKSILKYLIVVFTRKEELEDRTLEEYIKGSPDVLKHYLQEAGGGYIVFNNRGDKTEKETDSRKLIKRIDEMMKRNKDGHFTSEMFIEAEELMQAKLAVELEKEKLKMRKEIEEELRGEMEATMREQREYFMQLYRTNVDLVNPTEIEIKADKERTDEKLSTRQDKENAFGQIIHKEMERSEMKEIILCQIEQTEGVEKRQAKQQLAHVGEQIKQIVKQRKEMQNKVADERMYEAVEIRAQTLRGDERLKIEEEDEHTLGRFTQGIKNTMSSFISLFK